MDPYLSPGWTEAGWFDPSTFVHRTRMALMPAQSPPGPPPPTLRIATLAIAKSDFDAAFVEQGNNMGPEIEALYLEPLGLAPGTPFCAAAMTSWLRRAEAWTGRKANVAGGALAKGWRAQFIEAGAWKEAPLSAADIHTGDVLVWDRSQPDKPETAHRGHIGIVDHVTADFAYTIEGNASSFNVPTPLAVTQVERRLDDPRLLGVGRIIAPGDAETVPPGPGRPPSTTSWTGPLAFFAAAAVGFFGVRALRSKRA
jgi:hypothetical protein